MSKCPYCFEELPGNFLEKFSKKNSPEAPQCPHCSQFIIDPLVNVDYPGVDKKKCLYCGMLILTEARFCRFCQKWLDELDAAADDAENLE